MNKKENFYKNWIPENLSKICIHKINEQIFKEYNMSYDDQENILDDDYNIIFHHSDYIDETNLLFFFIENDYVSDIQLSILRNYIGVWINREDWYFNPETGDNLTSEIHKNFYNN